jgi:hypothetical protein
MYFAMRPNVQPKEPAADQGFRSIVTIALSTLLSNGTPFYRLLD